MRNGRPASSRWIVSLSSLAIVVACGAPAPAGTGTGSTSAAGPSSGVPRGLPAGPPTQDQVLLGRQVVITHDCGACHGGPSPSSEGWLAGGSDPQEAVVVGDLVIWARNLTPDPETGTGRYTERQIFNALRYGLRPGDTPDVEITSDIPGQGNHPAEPSYLAPGMPWTAWRRMTDEQTWAVVAYLKHGLQPVRHEIPEYDRPADGWASEFTVDKIGRLQLPPFPTANEELHDGANRDEVLRGRRLVASLGCTECHGGRGNPTAPGWLAGVPESGGRPTEGPFEMPLPVGEFTVYPRNLTPDNTTGLGRFSRRQIFNALRYGLRPGETADVEITSGVPGEGNHPIAPKYLAPAMPWVAWRHLSDEELWAITAYVKQGLRPVRNRVPDSEGPPDFWLSIFTPENFGSYPAPAFPTERERRLQ